jgi:hypothetical protein
MNDARRQMPGLRDPPTLYESQGNLPDQGILEVSE